MQTRDPNVKYQRSNQILILYIILYYVKISIICYAMLILQKYNLNFRMKNAVMLILIILSMNTIIYSR